MRNTRRKWFENWKERQGDFSPASILEFHRTAGRGNDDVGVVLKRKHVGTVSITQFVRQESTGFLYQPVSITGNGVEPSRIRRSSDHKGEEGYNHCPDPGQDHKG